jgi:hypothetical protein
MSHNKSPRLTDTVPWQYGGVSMNMHNIGCNPRMMAEAIHHMHRYLSHGYNIRLSQAYIDSGTSHAMDGSEKHPRAFHTTLLTKLAPGVVIPGRGTDMASHAFPE